MSDLLDVTLMTSAFVTLFVIMDPVGTVPIFLSLTGGRSKASARRAAILSRASGVNAGIFPSAGSTISDVRRVLTTVLP